MRANVLRMTYIRILLVCTLLVALSAHAEERIEIPFSDAITLKGWLFKPEGKGPFPAVIINHGSPPGGAPDRAKMDPKYPTAAEQFVAWGFVVIVPTRRGYGETGGTWAETSYSCGNPSFYEAGLETANDIAAAVKYARALPFVDANRLALLGQSAGGWGVLAAATRADIDVNAIINFAGGRGGHKDQQPNNNCNPDKLVRAAGDYGKEAKRATLWIYTRNDSYFAPELSARMFDAYQTAGGKGKMVALPAFGRDGHSLFGARDGVVVWKPIVETYLRESGLLK
jgi:dienelactone hydrolase